MRKLARLAPVWLLAGALGGCLSGQTGSPDCPGPRSCVCDPLYGGGALLRVRVESQQDGQLGTAVLELYPSEYGVSGVTVGDHLAGSVGSAQPCLPEAPLTVSEGDELLVLFSPGAGSSALLSGYYAWAIPWSDPLSFGATQELPQSELSVLASTTSCLERFHPEPAPPCHDTETVTCTAAGSTGAPARGAQVAWLAVGLAAALVYRARRRWWLDAR